MIIDDNYQGEDFIEGYHHDLMNNQYNFITPQKKMPIESDFIKDYISFNLPELYYTLQEGLYENDVNIAILKARYYPIKAQLFKIKSKYLSIGSKIEEADLVKIIGLLKEIFDKNGIKCKFIKKTEDLTEKIILMLKELKAIFISAGINHAFINNIIDSFSLKT